MTSAQVQEKKVKEKHKSKHNKHGDLSPKELYETGLPNQVAVHFVKLKIQELSSDDYFSMNHEFATWLKEEKNMFFSGLAADSARKLFSEFVEEWNGKKLDLRYYEGIETAPRSAHKWKIKQ